MRKGRLEISFDVLDNFAGGLQVIVTQFLGMYNVSMEEDICKGIPCTRRK